MLLPTMEPIRHPEAGSVAVREPGDPLAAPRTNAQRCRTVCHPRRSAPLRLRRSRSRRPSAHHRHSGRSEEHTSELQSLMRITYAVFCLKKNTKYTKTTPNYTQLHIKL